MTGFKTYLLCSPWTSWPRTDLGTHLGVSIKLPLGALFKFTNGPLAVEKTGVDEFSVLGKNTHIDKTKSTNEKPWTKLWLFGAVDIERNYRIPHK